MIRPSYAFTSGPITTFICGRGPLCRSVQNFFGENFLRQESTIGPNARNLSFRSDKKKSVKFCEFCWLSVKADREFSESEEIAEALRFSF